MINHAISLIKFPLYKVLIMKKKKKMKSKKIVDNNDNGREKQNMKI